VAGFGRRKMAKKTKVARPAAGAKKKGKDKSKGKKKEELEACLEWSSAGHPPRFSPEAAMLLKRLKRGLRGGISRSVLFKQRIH
jgi:hypothetical protein